MSTLILVLNFLITTVFNLYIFAVLLRLLLQWINADYYHPLSQFTIQLTAFPLKLLRKIIRYKARLDPACLALAIIINIIKFILLGVVAGAFPAIIGVFLLALADLLSQLVNLYFYLIIIVVIVSWIHSDYYNTIFQTLNRLVAPLLNPLRKIIPQIAGIDITPIIAILILQLISIILIFPLLNIARAIAFG